MYKKIIAVLMLFILGLLMGTLYPSQALTPKDIVSVSWNAYKGKFIQQDGRTIDLNQQQITTSEGQSYTMLRALWMNDKTTFDLARTWANNNLRLRTDSLYSWRWGKNNNNEWKILDPSSASDADQDIAYALILASKKWKVPEYQQEAKVLLADIAKFEVVETSIGPVLTAGDWAPKEENPTINPSYFAPYAYRVFAEIDPQGPWLAMIDTTYKVLESASNLSNVGLVPDWCAIEKKTGKIILSKAFPDGLIHSYDAWRTVWRVAYDAKFYGKKDPRPLNFLKKYKYPFDYWVKNNRLPQIFNSDGTVRVDVENFATLGNYLPAFGLIDKSISQKLYEKDFLGGYERMGRSGFWGDPQDYYAQNWVWFGLALWSDFIENPTNL